MAWGKPATCHRCICREEVGRLGVYEDGPIYIYSVCVRTYLHGRGERRGGEVQVAHARVLGLEAVLHLWVRCCCGVVIRGVGGSRSRLDWGGQTNGSTGELGLIRTGSITWDMAR